jgi:uncharacterized protein
MRGGIAALGTAEFIFDVIEDGREWSSERMGQYPLVLLAKCNQITAVDLAPWITPDVEAAFVDYVRAGGGLLVVHSGTVVAESPTLQKLIGGHFVRHPPKCDVTVTPQGEHPIVANVEPFTVYDEHYFMETSISSFSDHKGSENEGIGDPEADYFLMTTSEHGVQPGGWWREEGAGRVCVLTPGHQPEVWVHPEFQTLLSNALHWCHGKE